MHDGSLGVDVEKWHTYISTYLWKALEGEEAARAARTRRERGLRSWHRKSCMYVCKYVCGKEIMQQEKQSITLGLTLPTYLPTYLPER